jgi:hypothetical protein
LVGARGANSFRSKGAGPAELSAGNEEVAPGGGALSATAAAALIDRVAEERQADAVRGLAEKFSSLTPK